MSSSPDDETAAQPDAPTQAESPQARAAGQDATDRRATQPALSGRRSTLHSAAAARALRTDELLRAQGFGRVITVVCAVALLAVGTMAFSDSPTPAWLHATQGGALVACGLCAAWVWRRVMRSPNPRRLMRIFGGVCVAQGLVVQYYAGVFSPAPAVIAMGISYFGLADDRPFAYATCLSATAGYFVLALLVSVGALPDLGLFQALNASLPLRVSAVGTVLAVFAVLLWQARLSRNATHLAVERLDEALRLVQQREALLDEANQNLDDALGAGAGRRGPYTGRSVGDFLLGELLGRGGMGEVYAASHTKSGRAVAVKLLHGKSLAHPDVVQRFVREADLARKLRAPNLVAIVEVGETDDGAPFLAMERLRGHDLGWHLRRQRQLPLSEVVVLAGQIAAGLAVVHQAEVVHRDLKPANIFRVDGGTGGNPHLWKLLDFGVAKLPGSQHTLTQNAVIGTPGYMSPEQAQGGEIDARSDLFSLGSVLYRAITGRPPFSAPDTPQILFEIVYRNPARPSDLVPKLPADVDLVLALALAKDRQQRFQSGAELAGALASGSRGELSPALRSRGLALLRELPWGKPAKKAV